MTTFDEIEGKLACQDLITRFAVFRDKPQDIGFDDVFSDDAVFVSAGGHPMWGPGSQLQGEELRKLLVEGPKSDVPFHNMHIFTNAVVDLTGPDTARGTAYMIEYLVRDRTDLPLPQPISPTPNLIGDRVFGFRKTASGWRINRYEIHPILAAE